MAKRGHRKGSPQLNRDDLDSMITDEAMVGARLILTASAVVLANTFGWPQEWIIEWTKKTLQIGLEILGVPEELERLRAESLLAPEQEQITQEQEPIL